MFTAGGRPHRRKISPSSLKKIRSKVREITRRNRSYSMETRIKILSRYLIGWREYYGYCETPSVLRDLDSWIRRRLRNVQWKQWKVYRRRKSELIRLGVSADLEHTTAFSPKGPWNICHTPGVRIALNNKYFDDLGLPRLEPNI